MEGRAPAPTDASILFDHLFGSVASGESESESGTEDGGGGVSVPVHYEQTARHETPRSAPPMEGRASAPTDASTVAIYGSVASGESESGTEDGGVGGGNGGNGGGGGNGSNGDLSGKRRSLPDAEGGGDEVNIKACIASKPEQKPEPLPEPLPVSSNARASPVPEPEPVPTVPEPMPVADGPTAAPPMYSSAFKAPTGQGVQGSSRACSALAGFQKAARTVRQTG